MHVGMWSFVAWMLFAYAGEIKESAFLSIQATREEYLAQPVFAQFVFTQTLHFDRPARITELVVPMYLPENPLPFKIRLMQAGKPIYSWMYPLEGKKQGVVVAHLPFPIPTILWGDIEVVFNGETIDHDHKEQAPGLFIEPQDEYYKAGNYRIVNNEKRGDIAMTFMEIKTNYEIFRDDFQRDSISQLPRLLFIGVLALLLVQLPDIIAQMFFPEHRD
ncbi:MAG: hypothetical protein A3C02_02395 [Candidatus Andersenbacteria bacterium RIFCSPHIGHO2_02_FULL_45_11]|uniref:Uncharacterized protein n=1 Tax=Candidatus Andersenbacteria bacterium RIFCSPHIGHO2_12_FULL_45_11 TaxID=1797281 RepID=A0A1G1X291_9BACT|nr:MAG: hypothetical protein A3C02_02395 [Candidatus Andersenbacteria bacterium RIFCSPHIGHO2_02_FULL_45_11]OGY34122.1 MAG: hypothetical protein A3D99_02010 [Candidatus Andersenbacteria bacterium RIFCSPHIGHO2_12_FULL_45_11]